MQEFEVGSKVTVNIQTPGEYAYGCAEKLHGKTGIIEYKPAAYRTGGGEAYYLVKFNTPARPWSTNQALCTGFYFPAKDLKRTS